jgi:pimeloyl-ACP methyl ester carboxylesterase
VIAGHSLGGAMAARYALDHPDRVQGLALLAAYPDANLSASDLDVAVIYGTLDGLATVAQVEAARVLLPADSSWVKIEGGNHAQFGWYGAQAGDNTAAISREMQADITTRTLLGLLARNSSSPLNPLSIVWRGDVEKP